MGDGFRPRRSQYNDAYGDYQGGYGGGNRRFGGGGPPPFGPPLGFGPLPSGPPPLLGLPGPFSEPKFGRPRFDGPRFNGPPFDGPPFDGPPFGRRPPFQEPMILGRNVQSVTKTEKAKRFLMRCGLTRDAIKSTPYDVLQLIEPTHCGLCDLEMENFTMSKLHYLSKNHAKHLRKYMAQSSDAPYSSKEKPLKSRDLYCELCDVQITSKAHADSHYAGKPHRSIVEGKKPPKNPMLVQPGMQGRVNQLLRREKKFIKAEPPKPEATDAKPNVPPELYCDICKSAVTTTEQMTMHLNGKKHLTKEKQHILQMMKGAAGTDEGAGGEGEEEEEDFEAAEEGAEGGAEEGDQKTDWDETTGEKW